MVRIYLIVNTACIAIPAAIWIASVQVEYPDRLALIWIAIVLGRSSYLILALGTIFAEYFRLARGNVCGIYQAMGRIEASFMGRKSSRVV